ncbi:MAG: FtsX-like permease family protein, partial [Candidatus Methanosuratincola sp.]
GQGVNVQISTEIEPGSETRAFTVVGIVSTARRGQPQVYLPLVMLQPVETRQGLRYLAEAARLEWVEEAARQVRFILMRRLGVPAGAIEEWVRTPHQEIKSYQEVTHILMAVLGGIAAISLVVGGIGIMNIMLVSVTERTREIGIRKAVGARRRDIIVQFLTESALMSLIGGLLGLMLGWMLSYFGSQLGEWAFVVSPLPVIIAIGFSMAVGLFFGIYPALKAAHLIPAEALRYE